MEIRTDKFLAIKKACRNQKFVNGALLTSENWTSINLANKVDYNFPIRELLNLEMEVISTIECKQI